MKDDGRLKKLHKNKRRKVKGDLLFCSHCKKFLPKLKFYRNRKRLDGYRLLCIKCYKEYKSNWLSLRLYKKKEK